MATGKSNAMASPTRRVIISIEVDVPEATLADLAQQSLETGVELSALIAARYAGGTLNVASARAQEASEPAAVRKSPKRKKAWKKPARGYEVRDFAHLFGQAPEGQKPYCGSGRPPTWLLRLIEAELSASAKPVPPVEE